MKTSIGHKTTALRIVIILLGIIALVGINLLLLVPGQLRIGLALTVIAGGLLRYILRATQHIRYSRQDNGDLLITLPGGKKSVTLAESDITSIKPYTDRLPRPLMRGTTIMGQDRYILTATTNLYQIQMADGRRIVISPRSPEKIDL
jgi:hypothetical protein